MVRIFYILPNQLLHRQHLIHCLCLALDAAIAISGALDMCQQINFKRSMRLWQPFLTSGMRVDNILGKFADQYRHRLTKEQFLGVLRATSLSVSLRLKVDQYQVSAIHFPTLLLYLSSVINRLLK